VVIRGVEVVGGTKKHARSMSLLLTLTTLIVLLSSLCVLRFFYVSKLSGSNRKPKKAASDTCSLAVFLGSGVKHDAAKVLS